MDSLDPSDSPRGVTAADKQRGVIFYLAAVLTIVLGTWLAAHAYPQSFDWMYTVVSALASRKHNPEGGRWFAGALALAMLLLWPVVQTVRAGTPTHDRVARFGSSALRVGIVCGALVGAERLIFFHLSNLVRKGHELLALVAFLALFTGVLALYRCRSRIDPAFRWAARSVVVPLVAIGASQLALYFDQRDLGWVDAGWRAQGIPVWYSFAFWQWLAVAMLWFGIGHLVVTTRIKSEPALLKSQP